MALSKNEQVIFDALQRAAASGSECPKNEELMDLIDASSTSCVPGIMERLEAQGLIRRETFQRSRRVTIVASGQSTATPRNAAPHWRDRPRTARIPTPTPHALRHAKPDVGEEIMAWARARNLPYADALADLVWVGWEVERARS